MDEKWLKDFEDTLLPIQLVLRDRFQAAGSWQQVAEAAGHYKTHGKFSRNISMALIALVLMFLHHPVELDDQLEMLD